MKIYETYNEMIYVFTTFKYRVDVKDNKKIKNIQKAIALLCNMLYIQITKTIKRKQQQIKKHNLKKKICENEIRDRSYRNRGENVWYQ